MTCTVAVTTYNGEKYVREQLESILHQTRQPDEVVICDDCSTDSTAAIVRDFISANELKNWVFVENEKNVGWKENFKRVFDMASCELIFPCDQDDIWFENKLEIMSAFAETHPEYELISSDYTVLSAEEKSLDAFILKHRNGKMDGSFEKIFMSPQWLYVLRPGCCYCFRRTLYDFAKKYWNVAWAHDAQLWKLAIFRGSNAILHVSTMYYRRHGTNATSDRKVDKERRLSDLRLYIAYCDAYQQLAYKEKMQKEQLIIQETREYLLKRLSAIENCNIFGLVGLAIKNRKFYRSAGTVFRDIICALER